MKHYKQHRDFRGLNKDTQAELRRLAFKKFDMGISRNLIAKDTEVHYKTVCGWIRRRKGIEKRDCYGEKRGRALEEQKFINKAQETRIKTIIEMKTPDKAGLPFSLWTRKAIRELIKKKTKKTIAFQTVSAYTKRWGLTPQRPAKYAKEQNPKAIEKWLKEIYPSIVKRAHEEGAKIQWGDETGISLSTFYARSYAPRGKTPTIILPTHRESLSMISTIENRGDLRFMLYHGALNTDIFLIFLKRIIKEADQKIFLIIDNLRVHKAKKILEWVQNHDQQIELFSPTRICTTV